MVKQLKLLFCYKSIMETITIKLPKSEEMLDFKCRFKDEDKSEIIKLGMTMYNWLGKKKLEWDNNKIQEILKEERILHETKIAEIEKDLTVEIQRFDQEEQVGIREQGKLLEIERAKIGQEEGVALRDIEKALSVETSKFSQEQAVQEREIEKNLVIETAQINQNRQVELTEIDKLQTVEIARFGQEETEIVLQNPNRVKGMIVFFFTVTVAQVLLVIKKKQFEKVQAAELNF